VTINTTTPKTQTVKTVPTVYAPALTTTLTETCMGSTSLGGSGVGIGVTIGTTWHDQDCVRRLNAREIGQLIGDREAARAILCESASVKEAYDRIGRPCPGQPGYTPEMASVYMPQPPAPAPPPTTTPAPPPPPVNPAPIEDKGSMAPIPNPPEKGERG
jgi:hypothetical protein